MGEITVFLARSGKVGKNDEEVGVNKHREKEIIWFPWTTNLLYRTIILTVPIPTDS
jgi:hypothetical protein